MQPKWSECNKDWIISKAEFDEFAYLQDNMVFV